MIRGRDAEAGARHVAHRGDVRVVEHHALRLAGRPARVDQQRERVRVDVDRLGVDGQLLGERAGLDNHGVEVEPLPDHDLCPRVVDLVLHLRRRQSGVDRSGGRAEAPGREQRDDQLEPVRQGDRDDIALADAEARQQRRRAGDAVGEGRVVERDGFVGDGGCVGLRGGASLGQRSQGDKQGVGDGHRCSLLVIGAAGEPSLEPAAGLWGAVTKFPGALCSRHKA